MNATDAVAEVMHDTRGSVGTIRLAATTLLEAGDDQSVREQLLRSVDEEASRLLDELAALPVIVAACTSTAAPQITNLSAALRAASAALRDQGTSLPVTAQSSLTVLAGPCLTDCLIALLRIGVSRGGHRVSAREVDGAAAISITGADLRGHAVSHLVNAIGAGASQTIAGDGFAIPLAGRAIAIKL